MKLGLQLARDQRTQKMSPHYGTDFTVDSLFGANIWRKLAVFYPTIFGDKMNPTVSTETPINDPGPRKREGFFQEALKTLGDVAQQGALATNAEEAVQVVTLALANLLGDREAHLCLGNLKAGEFQQFACGAFFLTADGRSNLLIAPINYHPEQKHMKVDATLGHPGWMVKNQKPLLLANTDLDSGFVKILRTFRAGSVCYAPIKLGDTYYGQIICAAQGRNTMTQDDLVVHTAFCQLAAALWVSKSGPEYLKKIDGETA